MNETSSPRSRPILRLKEVTRGYDLGGGRLEVLTGVSVDLFAGELVALLGPSGSGKSTLLHIAGLLEAPDSGQIEIDGVSCMQLGERERTALRRRAIGFVFQFHHLLPEFSALENVMLARMIAGATRSEARARALELMKLMGLDRRADHRPAELSGGEQQRVAIARALANTPLVILADEPTGNLDPRTADMVFDELVTTARRHGVAVLIATHNYALAERMDRALTLGEDGSVVART